MTWINVGMLLCNYRAGFIFVFMAMNCWHLVNDEYNDEAFTQ